MKETTQHGRFAGQGFDAGHPDADQMTAFVEQALPAHAREEMLAHLAVCAECRATVAMALPPEEVRTTPVDEPHGRAWFAGWGWAWPAGAALAAMLVFAVYLRHEAVVRNSKTVQVAVARAPEIAAAEGRSLASTSSKVAEAERRAASAGPETVQPRESNRSGLARDEEHPRAGTEEGGKERRMAPAPAPTQLSSQMVAAEANAPNELASPVAAAPVPAAALDAAREKFAGAIGGTGGIAQGAIAGNNALKKAEAVRGELTLPSGLPVLSMASRGQEVLAIDARNAVFLSADAGQHWRLVPVRWAGKAVKAGLVSYGGGSGTAGGRMATFASVGSDVQQPVASATAPKPEEPARNTVDALQQGEAGIAAQKQSGADLATRGKSRLTGTVTDASGAAIPGATVTVSDGAGKNSRTAVTDRDGGYLVDGLPAGTYDVKAEARGFERREAKDVAVQGVGPSVENVTLNVGAATETVTVEAGRPAIETEGMVASIPAAHKTKAAAAPVFAITTDSGEQWTSADGVEWKKAGARD